MARNRRLDERTRPRPKEQSAQQGAPIRNQLLARLPSEVLRRLEPHLQPVVLERREVLFRAYERIRLVHFPDTALVSFVSHLETGETLEVGLVGRDGLAGTAVFPGITAMSYDGVVQVAGLAHRMSADVLRRELRGNEALSALIARYAQVLLVRSMQMSLCNMFHSVEQRCIRWLLTVNDLLDQDDIPLTHELMAIMLGVHRPTVTAVLGALRKSGLVREQRGLVVIRNRRRLEHACCECYGVMRNEQQRLLS